MPKTKKTFILDGDQVYATGVYLIRDKSVPGGWRVDEFEDDTYFGGLTVEDQDHKNPDKRFFTEEDN